MLQPTLAQTVEELRPILHRRGPIEPSEMELSSLLSLPVYASWDDPRPTLLQDLIAAIAALPDDKERLVAEYIFRQRLADEILGERRKAAVLAAHIGDPEKGQIRAIIGAQERWILGQIAHDMWARAMSPSRSGWSHGDGYFFTRFEQDVFLDSSLTRRTTRYAFSILTVRDRVEFYKLGTTYRGARRVGAPRLMEAGRRQQLVASVPVDPRSPERGSWHVVRFNPKLAFKTNETITLEEDTAITDPGDPVREVGLTVIGIDPVFREFGVIPSAALRVHVPTTVVPRCTFKVYDPEGDTTDRPLESVPHERADDGPIVFEPPNVREHRRYVIDWSADR
jgi:hypothetical protein